MAVLLIQVLLSGRPLVPSVSFPRLPATLRRAINKCMEKCCQGTLAEFFFHYLVVVIILMVSLILMAIVGMIVLIIVITLPIVPYI